MTTIHFGENEPVDVYWDSSHRFIGARAHAETWSSPVDFPRLVEKRADNAWSELLTALPLSEATRTVSPSRDKDVWAPREAAISAVEIPTMVLFTFDERTGNPVGYLVSEAEIDAPTCRCLKIFSEQAEVQAPLVPGGRHVNPQARFQVGRIETATLRTLPIRIRAKQTARQRWLSDVWHTVEAAAEDQLPDQCGSDGFNSAGSFLDDTLTLAERKKLLMLLFAARWEHQSTPDSARIAELGGFGIEYLKSRSAFTSTFQRLGIEIQTVE